MLIVRLHIVTATLFISVVHLFHIYSTKTAYCTLLLKQPVKAFCAELQYKVSVNN